MFFFLIYGPRINIPSLQKFSNNIENQVKQLSYRIKILASTLQSIFMHHFANTSALTPLSAAQLKKRQYMNKEYYFF